MSRLFFSISLVVLSAIAASAQTGPPDSVKLPVMDPDSILIDATYVPCGDSTESLLVLGDGRAIYARADQGIVINIGKFMMEDLVTTMLKARSVISKRKMDSCATVGVIVNLGGKRHYLVINSRHPAPKVKDLNLRIERIRKMAGKRLQGEIERLTVKVDAADQDTIVTTPPSLSNYELLSHADPLLVAQQWHCRGSAVVSAFVGRDGHSRRAFVNEVDAQGKCRALLAATALRAVLLSQFEPGMNRKCKPMATWMQVKVPFGRRVGK